MTELLRLLLAVAAAYLMGKLVSKLKLPAILGWLLTGMVLGPHALGLVDQALLDAEWYNVAESVMECTAGLMIGTELVWKRMRRSGAQIVVMTLAESLGTFVCVAAVFAAIFAFTGTPLYLALVFGGIALATAPAPSLSIVAEMKTAGPVTGTLIPMAVLDDLVAALVFFLVMAGVTAAVSEAAVSVAGILFLVFLPVLIGAVTGAAAGLLLRRLRGRAASLCVMLAMLLATAALGLWLNSAVLPLPALNFLLLGMAFSTAFANLIDGAQLDGIMSAMQPAIGLCMLVIILGLGAPLDYHLVFGAGIYTAVYIISRAGQVLRGSGGRGDVARAGDGAEVPGPDAAAALGRFAAVHGDSRVGAGGPRAGLRRAHPRDDSGGGRHKRGHSRDPGEEGLRAGRRAWPGRGRWSGA